MSDERMQILRMIEQGKLSASEGAQLLRALSLPGKEGNRPPRPPAPPSSSSRARWLHVSITDAVTGKQKVNISIPIGLVNIGLKMGARFAPDMNDSEYSDLIQSVQQATQTGQQGKIIDMQSESGDYVEVYVD
jgi:hypothetical protein